MTECSFYSLANMAALYRVLHEENPEGFIFDHAANVGGASGSRVFSDHIIPVRNKDKVVAWLRCDLQALLSIDYTAIYELERLGYLRPGQSDFGSYCFHITSEEGEMLVRSRRFMPLSERRRNGLHHITDVFDLKPGTPRLAGDKEEADKFAQKLVQAFKERGGYKPPVYDGEEIVRVTRGMFGGASFNGGSKAVRCAM